MISGKRNLIRSVTQQFVPPEVVCDIGVSGTKQAGERNRASSAGAVFPQKKAADGNILTPSIFHETWWLDAATGGDFQVVEVAENGKTVGSLPVNYRRRLGYREVCMPCMTPFLGPAVDEGNGSKNNRFLRRSTITQELIDKLPQAAIQYIKCHKGVEDVIAFQERGFHTKVQFTHEIDTAPEEQLWSNLRNKTRNVIRRATERLEVREIADPAEFIAAYQAHVEERKLRNLVDFKRSEAAVHAAVERGRGRILAGYSAGKMISANFCVWDSTTGYYLLSTRASDSGNGATSLLLWEAIKDATRRGLRFDLAGLGTPGSVLMFSGFGGAVSPRYVAVRANLPMRLLSEIRAEFHPEHYFF